MDYVNIYKKIIEYRKINIPTGYTERHHIIPRSLGGSDDESNLIRLTAREHYICHLLLTKMYPLGSREYYKMVHAYIMMCNITSNAKHDRLYKCNSRLYNALKTDYSSVMSENQLGTNNSQFGTMWIYNPILRENRKVSNTNLIEDGWYKGRVTDWDNHFSQKPCSVCNKVGLQSKRSKFCSIECKKESQKVSKIYSIKDDFYSEYEKTQSINKSLLNLGMIGAGGYYKYAVDLLQNHPILSKVYQSNMK